MTVVSGIRSSTANSYMSGRKQNGTASVTRTIPCRRAMALLRRSGSSEFTVDETNGRFEASCTNTVFAGEQHGTILTPMDKDEGDFSIFVVCDVRMR